VAHGGDWGAFIVDLMGVQKLPGLLAIHTNYPGTVPAEIDAAAAAGAPAPDGLSAEETRAYEHLVFSYKQVAYAKLMGTRPQTLYGIADSPVGLAAWLLDHGDGDGQPAGLVSALDRTTSDVGELTRDEFLDNVTLYWLTNTGVSATLELLPTHGAGQERLLNARAAERVRGREPTHGGCSRDCGNRSKPWRPEEIREALRGWAGP
jgi:hypothetical protein